MRKQEISKLDRITEVSLSEKQSVRTTFKLSEGANSAIDLITKKNNLKPKEVFDLMFADEKLISFVIEATLKNGKSRGTKCTRKTFVISKRVLRLLNKNSEKHSLSRDLVIENLILLYKALLDKHVEDERQREERALNVISEFWSNAESVEKQLKELLGDESAIVSRFGYVIVLLMNLTSAIESKLANGVPIDPDDMSQS